MKKMPPIDIFFFALTAAIMVTAQRSAGAPPVQPGMVETGVTVSVTYEAVN